MKTEQTHLLTLNAIRLKSQQGETYAALYDVLNDLQRNDSDIVGYLDKKIKGGELTSVEDIAEWFLHRFYEVQKDCQQLIKTL